MTLTINPSDYAQLLAKYQPKVIETEAEQLFYCSLGIVCIVDSSCSIDWFKRSTKA